MSLEQEQRCIHGMIKVSCYDCKPSEGSLFDDFEKKPRSNEVVPEIPETISLFGKNNSLEELESDITTLHLSSYPSFRLIKEVLELFPQLTCIRIPPTEHKRLLRRRQAVQLLEGRAIRIVSGRIPLRGESNLDERKDPKWREKREFLLSLDDKGKRVLKRGLELFEEAEIAYRYFCLGDPVPSRISYQDLAKEHNLSFEVCRNRILSFLGLLGYPSEEKKIMSGTRRLKSKFKKALESEREAKAKAKFEVFQPLPDKLQPRHWEQFLELTRIIHQSPDRFKALPQRTQQVLKLYFGLEGDKHHTGAMIVEVLGLDATHWMIEAIKNKGLIDLGIKKRKKPSIEPRSLEHCQHGLVKKWCGECNPPEEIDEEE